MCFDYFVTETGVHQKQYGKPAMGFIKKHPAANPGPHVYISVEDNGNGMSEDVRQNIFEPFFTTKPVGEGTGLGLSIVYKIIENLNGQITVQSEPNKGTEFIITLPIDSSIKE